MKSKFLQLQYNVIVLNKKLAFVCHFIFFLTHLDRSHLCNRIRLGQISNKCWLSWRVNNARGYHKYTYAYNRFLGKEYLLGGVP